jgi:hypothetical protein
MSEKRKMDAIVTKFKALIKEVLTREVLLVDRVWHRYYRGNRFRDLERGCEMSQLSWWSKG